MADTCLSENQSLLRRRLPPSLAEPRSPLSRSPRRVSAVRPLVGWEDLNLRVIYRHIRG